MQKQEFEERIERTVTDEQYKVIEEVYMWHPSIRNTSGKDEVAELYKSFGMTIFHDMLPRAKKAHELDEEYANCMKTLYNALEHAQIDKAKLTGEKYMRKSVGIGSQISQISGVYYPTRIDNYCKIVKGMKYYGRYMDDIYIIHEDKEYLKGLLNDIQGICDELGLFINPKKTQIVKLSHGFTFLKIKYNLTETGKVQERISKDSVTRMRRKLKKFRKLMDAGEMSFDDVRCAYASWKGGVSHYDSYNVVKSMDKLFDELFIHPFIGGGHRDEQNNNEQK